MVFSELLHGLLIRYEENESTLHENLWLWEFKSVIQLMISHIYTVYVTSPIKTDRGMIKLKVLPFRDKTNNSVNCYKKNSS
jgi:hypothetical protein